jgi:predicted ATPase
MILELSPLPGDEAVELLVARASAVRRHGRPTDAFSDEELEVLQDVVRQLDGIPLAIELAASRLGTLSPSQLAQRLDRRFRLLGDRRSDRPERHATLLAAFDWSWDLLAPEEQEALAVLSVFDGGFGLEAAEEILEEDDPDAPWPADLVQSLRDKSFVVLDEAPGADVRCRLLESVRAYASRKLDELGRTDEVRRRHAAYYLREGEALRAGLHTGIGIERLADLARERANLLGVAERAPRAEERVRAGLVLAPVLLARGPHSTLLQVLERAIADARTLGEAQRELGSLLVHRANLGLESGAFAQAERDASEAMRAAPLHMDVRARALAAQAALWNQLGRSSQALTAIREAVELSTRTGNRQLEGRIRHTLARILEEQDCIEEADVEYARSLRITRRAGDRWIEAAVLSTYASFLLTKRHELRQAEAMVKQAEKLLDRIGDARRSTRLLVHFAEGLARLGRQKDAEPVLVRALDLARQTGDRGREANVRFVMGWCRLDRGDVEAAETFVVEGARLARAINHRGLEAVADRLRGLVRLEQGRIVEARALLEEAAVVLEEVGYPSEAATALHGLALLHLREGRAQDALDAVDRALARRAPPWLVRQGDGLRALVLADDGHHDEALQRLEAVAATIDSDDRREMDLVEPWRLAVLAMAGAPDPELRGRIRVCVEEEAVAMEGRVARSFLEHAAFGD